MVNSNSENTYLHGFLNQPGSDDDVKKAFNSVDVDRSGLVDRDEFVLSIMGPAANDFGPIADMDRMDALINGLMKLIESRRAELEELASTEQSSKVEREELKTRMKNQRAELTQGMSQ